MSAGNIKHKYAVRLQTILLRHNGKGTGDIADFLGLHQSTVSLYINRCNTRGINSLLQDKTHLREYGKPHLVSKHHYSKAPEFEKKLEDVVGLYMNPPSNAVILCVDGKSQIQALERTQPILPIMRNVPETADGRL
ncbi:MAG: helix-turn-helix domain-containing protein [Treponema sp.]|nr:helix-turn-helix domain-containing protein [Treponema sp.]